MQKKEKFGRIDWFYLALLIIVVLVANYRLIFFHETYQVVGSHAHDFEVLFGYNSSWLHMLSTNHFAIWFPNNSFGVTSIGNYMSGTLHPLGPMFWSLISYPANFIIMVIIQYILLAIVSYLFFRRLGVQGLAAFFASAWMTLAGNTIWISFIWTSMNTLIAFFLCMWAMVGLFREFTLRKFLSLAAGGYLLFLSGNLDFIIYILYFIPVWLLIYGLPFFISKHRVGWLLILIGGAVFLAFLLSAAQLLPSSFLFSHCIRSQNVSLPEYQSTYQSAVNVMLGSLLVLLRKLPNIYFGIIPLGLSLFGLFKAYRKPAVKASVVVSFILIIIIYIPPLGLSKLLYHLPLYSLFIRHFKLYSILQFCLLILAAFGVDELIKRSPQTILAAGFFILGLLNIFTLPGISWKGLSLLVLVGAFAALYSKKKHFFIFLVILTMIDIFSFLWHTPYPLHPFRFWSFYEDLIKDSEGKFRALVMYPASELDQTERNSSLPVQVGAFGGGEAMDTWCSNIYMPTAKFYRAINPDIVVSAKDRYTQFDFLTVFKSTDFLNQSNRHLVNLTNLRYIFCEDMALKEAERRPILSDPDYNIKPPWINGFEPYSRELIGKGEGEIPIIAVDSSGKFNYDSTFDPGSLLRFSVSIESQGNASAEFKLSWQGPDDTRTADIFHRRMTLSDSGGRLEAGPIEIPLSISNSGDGTLSFQVKIDNCDATAAWINPVIVNHEKTLKWIAGEGRLMAFENTEVIKRARIVNNVLVAENDAEAVDIIRNHSKYDPRDDVVLFSEAPSLPVFTIVDTVKDDQAGVIEHHFQYVRVSALLKNPGWLILSDGYYPGWRVWVDGREQRIYRADLAFRGLLLEPGRHQILFRFHPFDLRIGLWVTIASILSIFLILVSKYLFKPEKSGNE